MRAEQIKNILSALAMDFMDGNGTERSVYLYQDDLNADDLQKLADGTVVKVTFEYVENPNKE